jgi:DNA mismatch repair ATPase MutS
VINATCLIYVDLPADYARIGISDKIFTRVGASDDLTLGQ